MRELKFRAWNQENQVMEEFEDLFWFEECGIHKDGDMGYKLMQYIGLHDKNGKEIFEGDIMEGGEIVGWSDSIASFHMEKDGWMFGHFFGEAVSVSNGVADIAVIGNIYENPELLSK